MKRRRALTIAGAVTACTAGATVAIATNVGLLGFAGGGSPAIGALRAEQPVELVVEDAPTTTALDPVPTVDPTLPPTVTTLPPEVVVQYEDIYVQDPPLPSPPAVLALDTADGPAPATPATTAPPVTAPTTSAPTTTSEPPLVEEDTPIATVSHDDDDDDDEHGDDRDEHDSDEHEHHDGDEDDD